MTTTNAQGPVTRHGEEPEAGVEPVQPTPHPATREDVNASRAEERDWLRGLARISARTRRTDEPRRCPGERPARWRSLPGRSGVHLGHVRGRGRRDPARH